MENIVLFDNPEAATTKTVTGWFSRHGRYYGENESSARYDGCTHKKCDCGNIMERSYMRCKSCRGKLKSERYNNLEYREWDGKIPVVLWDDDKYFFSEEDIYDWLEDFDIEDRPEEVSLLICEPNNYFEVSADYWNDIMPEDSDGDLPKELEVALKKLNEVIRTLPPASYEPGKIRTSFIPDYGYFD